MAVYHLVCEVSPVVDASGTTQKILITQPHAECRTKPTDVPANTPMLGVLQQVGSFRRSMFESGRMTGPINSSFGAIVCANPARDNGSPGDLDNWASYSFSGADLTVYYGELGSAYPSQYTTVFKAKTNSIVPDSEQVTIILRDDMILLDQPVVISGFLGSGGLEGFDTVSKTKQFASGSPGFLPPILLDRNKQLYFVHSNGAGLTDLRFIQPQEEINPYDVFDMGIRLDRGADYASVSQLLSQSPDEGEARFYFGSEVVSTGYGSFYGGPVYFRLGSPPAGDVRVYTYGTVTAEDLARNNNIPRVEFSFGHMAMRAGVPFADVHPEQHHLGSCLVDSDETYLSLLSKACLEQQAWFGFNRLGVFRSNFLLDPESSNALYGIDSKYGDNSGNPTTSLYEFSRDKDNFRKLTRKPVPGMENPIWSVAVRGGRTWPCAVANGASAKMKDYLSRDPNFVSFQGVSDTGKTAHPGAVATTLEVPNGDFPNVFSRELMLERFFVLYGGARYIYELECNMTEDVLDLDLHDVVTLKTPRFYLSAGKKLRVVGITIDLSTDVPTMKFSLWGGEIGDYTGNISIVHNGAPQLPAIQTGIQNIPNFTQLFYGVGDSTAGGYQSSSLGNFTQDFFVESGSDLMLRLLFDEEPLVESTGYWSTIGTEPGTYDGALIARPHGTNFYYDLVTDAGSPGNVVEIPDLEMPTISFTAEADFHRCGEPDDDGQWEMGFVVSISDTAYNYSSTMQVSVAWDSGTQPRVIVLVDGTFYQLVTTPTISFDFTSGSMTHIAVEFEDGAIWVYIYGTEEYAEAEYFAYLEADTGEPYPPTTSVYPYYFNLIQFHGDTRQGYIDNLDLTRGRKYGGNFTPAERPFECEPTTTEELMDFEGCTNNTAVGSFYSGINVTFTGATAFTGQGSAPSPDTVAAASSGTMSFECTDGFLDTVYLYHNGLSSITVRILDADDNELFNSGSISGPGSSYVEETIGPFTGTGATVEIVGSAFGYGIDDIRIQRITG